MKDSPKLKAMQKEILASLDLVAAWMCDLSIERTSPYTAGFARPRFRGHCPMPDDPMLVSGGNGYCYRLREGTYDVRAIKAFMAEVFGLNRFGPTNPAWGMLFRRALCKLIEDGRLVPDDTVRFFVQRGRTKARKK